jgi:hypothetical protein
MAGGQRPLWSQRHLCGPFPPSGYGDHRARGGCPRHDENLTECSLAGPGAVAVLQRWGGEGLPIQWRAGYDRGEVAPL